MSKDILYHDLSAMRPDTRAFLDAPKRMLIGGEFVETASEGTIDSEDPGLGVLLARVPSAGQAEVDAAVAAARRAFVGDWANTPPAGRAACLQRLGELIVENLEQLAEIEGLDTGKPAHVAAALDIPFASEVCKYNAGWATKLAGRTFDLALDPGSFHTYTRTEPVGVIAGIYAWNFPFAQAIFKLAPAIAAGCTVVLKPAEQTPLSSLRLAELCAEAGFPPGVVNVLTGYGHITGAALAAHPDVDKITFTGSTAIGRAIAKAAADSNFKRVTLEMGGKSPNIIFADAEIEMAIQTAAAAIFGNSGQVCNAGSRLLIQEPIYDQVVEGVARLGDKMQLGCALNPQTELGPLMSAKQLERVHSMVQSAREHDVDVVSGGQPEGERGHFYNPTVLANVDPEAPIARDEIFGPVLCAMRFSDEEQAIAMANDTQYGLAASIWTENAARCHRVANKVSAGAVWVNAFGVFDPNLPFGGYKQSGWGREFALEGVEAFRETKAVSLHLGSR